MRVKCLSGRQGKAGNCCWGSSKELLESCRREDPLRGLRGTGGKGLGPERE